MTEYDLPNDASLLILDDDGPFRTRLGRALEQRGFTVETAETVTEAKAIARAKPPAFAVLDMRLDDGNGLDVIDLLHQTRPDCRMVMLRVRKFGYSRLRSKTRRCRLSGQTC